MEDTLMEMIADKENYDPIIRFALEDLLYSMDDEDKIELAWRAFIKKRRHTETRVSFRDIFN